MSDDFSVLQVARHAEPEVIKAAYKALSVKYHPDMLPPDATAAQRAAAHGRMTAINAAYGNLKDGGARPQPDPPPPPPPPPPPRPPPPPPGPTPGPKSRASAPMTPPSTFDVAVTLPNYWKAMAAWGKETEQLDGRERKFAFQIGKGIEEEWEFTAKQLKWARTIWERIHVAFHPVMNGYLKT